MYRPVSFTLVQVCTGAIVHFESHGIIIHKGRCPTGVTQRGFLSLRLCERGLFTAAVHLLPGIYCRCSKHCAVTILYSVQHIYTYLFSFSISAGTRAPPLLTAVWGCKRFETKRVRTEAVVHVYMPQQVAGSSDWHLRILVTLNTIQSTPAIYCMLL